MRELHNIIQHLAVVADEQARIEDLPEFMQKAVMSADTGDAGGESASERAAESGQRA